MGSFSRGFWYAVKIIEFQRKQCSVTLFLWRAEQVYRTKVFKAQITIVLILESQFLASQYIQRKHTILAVKSHVISLYKSAECFSLLENCKMLISHRKDKTAPSCTHVKIKFHLNKAFPNQANRTLELCSDVKRCKLSWSDTWGYSLVLRLF